MQITERRLEELIPYENNPRKNDDAVKAVAESIKEFGFRSPIILDENDTIIAGHTRLKAAKKLGLETVPTIKITDLTPEQVKAYRLADNKAAEQSRWDYELLEQELRGIEDIDMTAFGFREPDKTDLADIDEPQPEENTTSKTGDIWMLGNHRLMCGSSANKDDLDALMKDQLVDLVITDPPCGVAIGDKNKAINTATGAHSIEENIENDAIEMGDLIETVIDPAYRNALEHAADSCAIYSFAPPGDKGAEINVAINRAGWNLRHELVWIKNAPVFSMGRLDYDYQQEEIFYGWNKTHNFYLQAPHSSVFDYDKDPKDMTEDELREYVKKIKNELNGHTSVQRAKKPQSSRLHPTMKPPELIANLMSNSSKKGDIVLDIFGGSGTTLVVAEDLGRTCYMMEIDPHYCDVIIKRWEEQTGKKAIKME